MGLTYVTVLVGNPANGRRAEGFGLVLDPFRRELRPMKLPLKGPVRP